MKPVTVYHLSLVAVSGLQTGETIGYWSGDRWFPTNIFAKQYQSLKEAKAAVKRFPVEHGPLTRIEIVPFKLG